MVAHRLSFWLRAHDVGSCHRVRALGSVSEAKPREEQTVGLTAALPLSGEVPEPILRVNPNMFMKELPYDKLRELQGEGAGLA